MANLTKRIIDLQTTSTLGSDDYVMIDGATNGTKKYLLKDILDEIEDVKDGTGLATGAVTTDKLAAGAVTNAKINDGAVDTTNIADDAVTSAKIDDGAVGTDALAANAVTGAKIATGAVGTGNIASEAVTLDKIASDSNATSSRNGLMSSADKAKLDGFSAASNYALKSDIVGAYIFKGSVNTENDLPSTGLTVGDVYNIIAASSYGESGANVAWTGTAWDALGESFDISDGAIDTEQLANGAVTNDKLAEEAMTTVSPAGYIYTDPTYGSEIRQGYEVTFGNSDETIKLPKVNSGGINDLLIDVENIPTIPEKKIGSGAITANKIAAGAVSTEKLANSAVNTDKLATAAVSTDKIASLAVTTNKIAAGAVDNSKLANNAVGTAQIVNGAVTSEKLGSDVTSAINAKAAASDVTALQEYVDEELEYKADIDGYYSQLTAGLAENLIGRGDAVPAEYLYRTAGGTADIEDGIATIDCIKGNTLVWNQMCNNGNFESAASWTTNGTANVSDGVYTATRLAGTYLTIKGLNNSAPTVAGHKYLFIVDAMSANGKITFIPTDASADGTRDFTGITTMQRIGWIWAPEGGLTNTFTIRNTASAYGTEEQLSLSIANYNCFDLTLMFGAGNEPETVEEFEAMFPLPYYPYSAPKLLPVDIRGIETVGFNQWDEEWESGIIGTAGNAADATKIRSKNYIPVIPGQTYYVKSPNTLTFYGYDAQKNVITYEFNGYTTIGRTNATLTIPSGVHYLRFYMTGTTYNNDICINLSWSGYRNGEYEEHWSAERPIDTSRFFPTGLKKVGDKADALYADHYDTVIGEFALNVDSMNNYENYPGWVGVSGLDAVVNNNNAVVQGSFECGTDLPISINTIGVNRILFLGKNDYNLTQSEWMQKYAGQTFHFYLPLATPTTTPIDPPLNLSYKVSDFGTERIMVDETADAPQTAPVPMEVEYGLNAIDTIRRLPTNYVPRTELEPKLDEKADVDGYYAAMTVGAADNLTGRGDGVSGQYLYRTAGGDEDIADGIANIRSIKGQTLVWNQLVQILAEQRASGGATITKNVSGAVTVSGTVTSDVYLHFYNGYVPPLVAGNKYLVRGPQQGSNLAIHIPGNTGFNSAYDGQIITAINSGTATSYIYVRAVAGFDGEITFYPQLFDLTLMFGAGNEPSTVAEFEALFPKPYYPYSEPTLLSVNMEGIETVGFNQWDEELEIGSISTTTGQNADNSAHRRAKNYIPVFPNTDYYYSETSGISGTFSWAVFYDADKNILETPNVPQLTTRANNALLLRNGVFTTPESAAYMRFYVGGGYSTVYNHDICLNLSWSGYRNGEYEEYWKSQREIPVETYFPEGMRLAGNARDELTPSKAITRVGKAVLDGSQANISYFIGKTANNISVVYPRTSDWVSAGFPAVANKIFAVACDKLPSMRTTYTTWTGKGISGWSDNTAPTIISPTGDDSITTEEELNAWLAENPLTIYYELAEPTEVEIDPPLNLSYKVSDFGTEKVMVDEEADSPQSAPPIIQTAYGINATDTVRRLPTQYISHESFQQFVAALQSAVGITVTETWDENDGRYEYTVTQTGE